MSGIPVVGREPELDAIAATIDAVVHGESRLLILRGEAGIGKTRLLDVVREQAAARRFAVLDGRATELENDVPLAPVMDALEPAVRNLPLPALDDLDAEQLRLLAAVLPGIGDAPPSVWAPASPAERWRLHRALRDLLDVLGARRPVALVLDDVHWADPATLELLDHIVRRPPSRAHLVAIAVRPGAVAERLLAARRSTGAGVELELPPLGRPAADLMLAATEDPAERERLFRESGGNPLLLEELARVGPESDVPSGVVAAVAAELLGLPGPARALLDGAAVVGDPFDLDLAAAVGGLGGGDALGALDVLVERALVRRTQGPRRFAFRHPVIRSAVYAAIPAGTRLASHATAASALGDAPLPVRARHLAHAAAPGDVEAAATLRAAAAIVRPQAPTTAADWLLAARRADPGIAAEGVSTLAETLVEAGRLQEALEIVDAAVAAAGADHGAAAGAGEESDHAIAAAGSDRGAAADTTESDDAGAAAGTDRGAITDAAAGADDGEVARAAAGAGRKPLVRLAIAGAVVERQLGRHVAARERLERALESAPPNGRDAARLMADLALSAFQRGDYAEVRRWAEQARGIEDADRVVRAAAAAMLAPMLAFAGDGAAADAEARVALADIEAATDEELVAAAELLTAVAWAVLALERFEDVLAVSRRAAEVVRRGGNGPAAIALDTAVVSALGLLGRIEEAVQAADQAEQAARVTGSDQGVQWTLWMRAWILLEHGDLDMALAAAEESVVLAEQLDDSALVTVAKAVLGGVLAAHGRYAEGQRQMAAYDVEPGWICRWAPPLVEAEIALGDLESAAAHAARASAIAAEIGLAGARAAAGRAEALVALAREDWSRAAELALGSVADAELIGSTLEAARGHLVAGRALAATDKDAAITELVEAERLASAASAARVRDEAVRGLRRLGRRVGRGGKRAVGETGVTALSPREREIADLVADGRTNRDIAGRLFLSEKTIEAHLSRVFGKLGVRSRAQVAASIAVADDD